MEKEILTAENVLTWQDIINFGEKNYRFGFDILERACSRKSKMDLVPSYIQAYFHSQFVQEFPDFPFREDYFNYYFILREVENGNKAIYIDRTNFFYEIIDYTANRNLDSNFKSLIFSLDADLLKNFVIGELQKSKKDINEALSSDYISGFNLDYKVPVSKEQYKEALLMKRKMIAWTIRHYDELCSFLNKEVSFELLNYASKDKFLLILISYSLNKSKILPGGPDYDFDSLRNMNDYLLLLKYFNQENKKAYVANFTSILRNGSSFMISSDTIEKTFTNFCTNHPDIVQECNFSQSYEEVLQKKALETWKRIQSEKHARNIKLNFEMIRSGNKIKLSNYQKNQYVKVTSNSEKRQEKLKRAYDLLEEKMDYFSQTNPSMELVGIDTFTGYTAYMYSNGVVVLEKLYKKFDKDQTGKDVIVPTTDEAIYVMNYTEFAELSRYTKMELIQEINDFQNPNVKRIYHTPNGSWKNKVEKLIHGPGYGNLDYELFDQLISNLSDSRQKRLTYPKE